MVISTEIEETEVFVFPASYAQKRLWFLDQFEPGSPYYNIPMAVRISGKLNLSILDKSLNEVVRRHESLRTTFSTLDNQPVQIVHPSLSIQIKIIDLSRVDDRNREQEAIRLVKTDATTGFDLQHGPLLRFHVIRFFDEDHIVLLNMHHIISDGWSMSIFYNELFTLYDAYLKNKQYPLPPILLQYADYSEWQVNYLQGEILENQLVYWRSQLGDLPPVLELPSDKPRPAVVTNNGANYEKKIPENLSERIKNLSQKEGVTLFMTLLAAFQVLLYRYSHQDDISVGTPIANRTRGETEQIIGLFINTLVMRSRISGKNTFHQLLSSVKQIAIDAYAHQDIPFELLVEDLQPERDMSHSPLFQVMFILQNANIQGKTQQFEDLHIQQLDIDSGTSTFDLTISVTEHRDGLSVSAEYNTDLFSNKTISHLLDHYEILLTGITDKPGEILNFLPLLSEAEKRRQLIDWNKTKINFDQKNWLIQQLFEYQVKKTPDALAVVVPEKDDYRKTQKITYLELNQKANLLAHHLRKCKVGPEVIVGICMAKSLEMIIAILGILKAGGAYLPIDPTYPSERLAYMVSDSQINLLITQDEFKGVISEERIQKIILDADWEKILQNPNIKEVENPEFVNEPGDLVYMIYTSGSTGQAKGVMIEQHNLVNAFLAWKRDYQLDDVHSHLQMANFSFDVFTGDLVRALCSGGKLVLCHKDYLLSPEILYPLMIQEQIDIAEFVPAVLRLLIQHLERTGNNLHFLRMLICGSDSWYANEYKKFITYCGAKTRLINSFGLTEATIDSTFYEGSLDNMSGEQVVPIGRPFPNSQLYILDEYFQLVPEGVKGELFIGGDGVARGYYHKPELNSTKFIDNPFIGIHEVSSNKFLYRTGDAVRYLHDGNVEFLGRLDFQVKIRGFRVETGEIEATIKQFPGIIDALVLASKPPQIPNNIIINTQQLVGYIVIDKLYYQRQEDLPINDLVLFLKNKLPDFMVPPFFVVMDVFPLTPNGKIDRQSLSEPDWSKRETEEEYISPRTPIEVEVANLWQKFLRIDRVGINSNFFDIGGHSLLATQVISRIRDTFNIELPLRVIFETPTISGLAEQIDLAVRRGTGIVEPPIVPIPRDRKFPLSYSQQRLWFLDQLEPDSASYNLPEAVRLNGALNIKVLETSLNEVIKRHESLRTTFQSIDGSPHQEIKSELFIPIKIIDISAEEEEQKEKRAIKLAQDEAGKPFDLSKGPLLRAMIIILNKQDFFLLLTMHHIIGDNWSSNLLVYELTNIYGAIIQESLPDLPQLYIQYPDYAYWQRNWLQGEILKNQIEYWKEQLENSPPILDLPLDYPRPAIQTFNGTFQTFSFSRHISDQLHNFCKKEGVTMFMLLLAAFEVLLFRLSNQEDINIGTPIANRNRSQIENLIGFFVNTLVIRAKFFDEPSFRQHLQNVHETTLAAFAHQDTPFEMIVDAVHPERNLSHSPIFQVMFVTQNVTRYTSSKSEIKIEPLDIHSGTAKYDLTLFMNIEEDELSGALEYNTDLFDFDTISRMIHHYIVLVENILEKPDEMVSRIPLLSNSDKQKILVDWNQTKLEYPSNSCTHQLIEAQVDLTPDSTAVIYKDQQLTYKELDEKANQLAHFLRTEGIKTESLVGIYMERSLELVISILGVLKAGGAYVPLDPIYPEERLAYMISDASLPVLLTKSKLATGLLKTTLSEQCKVVKLDTDWQMIEASPKRRQIYDVSPDNLAYVIYTSGSTGKPKGTMILHRGLVNYLTWCKTSYPLSQGQGSPVHSSISFDLTVTSLFTPLLSGKKVLLLSEELGVEALGEALRDKGDFSLVKITPAHLQLTGQQLTQEEAQGRTHAFIIGGENLTTDHIQFWLENSPETVLVNEYGPTETVVGCCVYTVPISNTRNGVLPIGKPIINTQLFVLDKYLQPVPIGVHGELCIGGVGVSRGYLNRPDLTEEKFVKHPFDDNPNAKLYRTGDLAKYLPDGTLECLGRIDFQVKIRGFRVELGEIETVIAQHPGVNEVVVWVYEEEGIKRLIAYLVVRPGFSMPDSSELRQFVSSFLPEYMIPSVFIELASLPLNSNGKVERKLLPIPEKIELEHKQGQAEPQTWAEKILAGIWAKVLGISNVSIHDNFFDLGGDSILSIQIIVKANQAGLGLTPRLLFENPTIASLARVVGSRRQVIAEQGIVFGTFPLTPIQKWFFDLDLDKPNHWNQSIFISLPIPLNKELLVDAFRYLLIHHDILRTHFKKEEINSIYDWHGYNDQLLDENNIPVEWIDLENHNGENRRNSIFDETGRVQKSLDIYNGSVIKAVYFYFGTQNPGRLFITIHHLVMDGVSWRILLEDFQEIYSSLKEGKKPQLPYKTTSFRDWARKLSEYSQSEELMQSIRDWTNIINGPFEKLPYDFSNGTNYEGDSINITVSLEKNETRSLLTEVITFFRIEIIEVLLTAFSQAIINWTGNNSFVVDLESHGREDIFDEIDVSRTVGWFTTLFPFRIVLDQDDDLGNSLEKMKMLYRKIPKHGFDYGVIKYLIKRSLELPEFQHNAEISFNYLGQMDQIKDPNLAFETVLEKISPDRNPINKRTHLIDINGGISEGRLSFEWTFSKYIFKEETIFEVANRFIYTLKSIVEYSQQNGKRTYTKDDFKEFGWDEDDIGDILSAIGKIE